MRYDVCTPRKKKDGGTYWVKVGSAWSSDGKPPQIVFDALPIPDAEGRCVVSLFEPRDTRQPEGGGARQEARHSAPPSSGGGWGSRGGTAHDLDHDIPGF